MTTTAETPSVDADALWQAYCTPKFAGAEWLVNWLTVCDMHKRTVSPLGRDVADVLGQTFSGIYHIQKAVTHPRVAWGDTHCIVIVISRTLSNTDFAELHDIVVGCALRKLRVEIGARARGYLDLTFTNGYSADRLVPLVKAQPGDARAALLPRLERLQRYELMHKDGENNMYGQTKGSFLKYDAVASLFARLSL